MRGVFVALLFSCVAVYAQVDPYTVTVTATQTLNIQPDQAVINGGIETGIGTSFSDVVNILQPAGITAADLTGVSTVNGGLTPNPNAIVWSFTLAVPLASLNSTLAALAQLQKNTSLNNLYFSVQGLQVSPQLQASQQCPESALMASAQAQALAMAQAAGFGLGSLLAISDGSVGAYPGTPTAVIAAYFNEVTGVVAFFEPAIQTPIVCTVVAKFSLMTAPGSLDARRADHQ